MIMSIMLQLIELAPLNTQCLIKLMVLSSVTLVYLTVQQTLETPHTRNESGIIIIIFKNSKNLRKRMGSNIVTSN